jgi:hypothetical protein
MKLSSSIDKAYNTRININDGLKGSDRRLFSGDCFQSTAGLCRLINIKKQGLHSIAFIRTSHQVLKPPACGTELNPHKKTCRSYCGMRHE